MSLYSVHCPPSGKTNEIMTEMAYKHVVLMRATREEAIEEAKTIRQRRKLRGVDTSAIIVTEDSRKIVWQESEG